MGDYHEISRKSWHYRLLDFMYINPLWGEKSYYFSPKGLDRIKSKWGYWARVVFACIIFAPIAILLIPGFLAAQYITRFVERFWAELFGWFVEFGMFFVITFPGKAMAGLLTGDFGWNFGWAFLLLMYAWWNFLVLSSYLREVYKNKVKKSIRFVD